MVCGANGEVRYSRDCVTWSEVPQFATGTLTSLTYGKGRFLVVEAGRRLWTAEETPLVWKPVDEAFSGGIGDLLYANGRFVLAGDKMTASSEDGLSWTEHAVSGVYNRVVFGNGRYAAVGADGAVAVSVDGRTWLNCSESAETANLYAVAYGSGLFLTGGAAGVIRCTKDFAVWETAAAGGCVRALVRAENGFFALLDGEDETSAVLASEDGRAWTVLAALPQRLWSLTYGEGYLMAAGSGIWVLDFGLDWQDSKPEAAAGQYIWERMVLRTTDGETVVSGGVCTEAGLSGTPGQFLVIGADGKPQAKSLTNVAEVGA